MKQIECNKCGKHFEVEGEWGYCPFCENDNVELKLPHDLIKATDYDKAKDRIIHEFEYVNGKFIQHYALGGEHELSTQEIVDCLNALLTIDCDLRTAYAYIKGQNDKIKMQEKQLKEQPKQIVEKIREKIVDYNIKYSSAVDVLNCLDLVLDNLLKEMK